MTAYKVLEVNVDDMGFGGVFALVKNVIEHKPAGLQIDIACLERFVKEENVRYLNELGTQVHFVGYEGNKLVKQVVCLRNLKKLIQAEKYDCVHIHGDVANKLMISGLAAKWAGTKKIILHSHAAGVDGNHRELKKLFHNCCKGFLKHIATEFLSCSDLATAWMFPNVDRSRVVMVNNGVDLEKFRFHPQTRAVVRAELGLKDEFLVGHVGRFAYQKNHEYLLDVFEAVHKKIADAKLLLVGQGPLEGDIRRKVAEKGLQSSVIFYGVSHSVQELFQAMDVFVLPSHFEGLPIVGVEAQAAGLPVVFSEEITREAKLTQNVTYLPIGQEAVSAWSEKLEQVAALERKDTYEQLKRQGFSIQDTVNTLLSLYKRS